MSNETRQQLLDLEPYSTEWFQARDKLWAEDPDLYSQWLDLEYRTDEVLAELEYLSKIPADVPQGRVVVHNHVRPTRRLGSRGFRAWLAERSERLEVCGCDWAPELGEHYRVRRDV